MIDNQGKRALHLPVTHGYAPCQMLTRYFEATGYFCIIIIIIIIFMVTVIITIIIPIVIIFVIAVNTFMLSYVVFIYSSTELL